MFPVTADDLWREVGRILERARGGVAFTNIRDATGIDPKTLQSIEAGSPGNLSKVERYAQHLGLSLVDVLRSLLSAVALTTDAAELLRRWDDLSPRQRKAYLQLLRVAGPDVAEEPPTSSPLPPARRGRARRKP